MAKDKKKRFETHVSPRGDLIWPKLMEPDFGSEEYPCPEGKYETNLRLPAKAAQPFVDEINELASESLKNAIDNHKKAIKEEENGKKKAKLKEQLPKWETKHLPYEKVLDDNGDETGEVDFKFKMTASGEYKKKDGTTATWTRKPAIFDAMGKIIKDKKLQIWSGSEGKVSFCMIPYATLVAGASVKLALEAVQILNLVNSSERSAEEYGFGAEEGGYVYVPEGGDADDDDDAEEAPFDTSDAGSEDDGEGEEEF